MLSKSARLSLRRVRAFSTNAPAAAAPAAATVRQFKYFDNLEVRDGVAIVRFNGPEKMNTISANQRDESEILFKQEMAKHKDIKAIVFASSKPDNFIAGADIDMLQNTEDKSQLSVMTAKAHEFWAELKAKGLPMVAAINGACLGGGLEWALYCDYRIATTDKKTVLGLPEVKLGLLPGMAGTYHLPRLVGLPAALDMILTGKNIRPDKARKMGLVDLVVDPASLIEAAVAQAKGLAAGTVHRHQRKDKMGKFFEMLPPGRDYIFKKAKETVDKASGGKYPAPYAILDVLKTTYGQSIKEACAYEGKKFAELAATPESSALIGIFKGMSAVKKHDYGKPSHALKNIAVLGAGLMGSGIAQVSADNGKYRVLMKDRDAASVGKGEKAIDDAMKAKMKKKKMTNAQYCEVNSRVIGLHDELPSWKRHFASADMVIEAVFEDIKVKHAVLQQMEDIIPDHCVFASNTSAIPIAKIAEGAKRPERVIGMHYFSPVPMMPLLEIITHAGTSDATAAAAMEVGSRQGKTAIFVKDVPGFYVNRALAPFMSEVTALVADGVPLDVMDKAMRSFGMPVGPITLADEVGIDVSSNVGRYMRSTDLAPRLAGGNAEMMDEMVKKGWLGRKTGKGFYLYPKDAKKGAPKQLNPEVTEFLKQVVKSNKNVSVEDIQMRAISRFVNESAYCVQDGVLRSPTDGDIGAVFGIGFPPFLGGPFRMLDIMGVSKFVDRMYRYRDEMGEQFEPCQLLKDHAATNKKFHSK